MKFRKLRFIAASVLAALPLVFSGNASAVVVPTEGKLDPRIRHVTYERDQVFRVLTNRGVATLILLGDDEKIEQAGGGFESSCKPASTASTAPGAPDGGAVTVPPAAEWLICAAKDTNRIWVKPLGNARFNNLELVTNKRVYSFEFEARRAVPKQAYDSDTYRVVFDYPKPIRANGMPAPEDVLASRMHDTLPAVKNWKDYTMQALEGGEAIAPTQAFDDNRLTYFLLPGNRDLPTVWVVGADGSERQVDSNIDPKTGYLVVHETARRFLLRLGKAVVGIWNDGEMPDLPATNSGTTVQGVQRQFK
ncbi:TrbG/VirB9 family P-type conjugative transfer protein [Burkholderia sp. Ac-20345]|uniref:TrbG/VirB9 family P-type conjugative transfer protein n=1 Tax=Burkholderia sp. Ac-20345 TaxID=2703891 RepID=UPI00197C133C|nr:TrbG/VirB9 family P-type conjugative transfer protein [Burkholderia sp. Ac-20345]MBN3780520.1 TrbG/VirB9 family P-type conjugative transfer protein [Burkholderia sp. Ac-20345]